MNKVQGFFICKSKRSYQASVCTDTEQTDHDEICKALPILETSFTVWTRRGTCFWPLDSPEAYGVNLYGKLLVYLAVAVFLKASRISQRNYLDSDCDWLAWTKQSWPSNGWDTRKFLIGRESETTESSSCSVFAVLCKAELAELHLFANFFNQNSIIRPLAYCLRPLKDSHQIAVVFGMSLRV